MTSRGDALLRWVSEVGSGPLQRFYEACESLRLDRYEALRNLGGLGHLEVDWKAGRFSVAPLTAVELPGLADRVFLTGARDSDLKHQVEGVVSESDLDVDPSVEFWPQGDKAPSTALISMDVAQLGNFSDLTGAVNAGIASEEISRLLPVTTVESATISADPDLRFPHARVVPETLAPMWNEIDARLSPGLWTFFDHGRRKTAILIGEDLIARRVLDARYGPFIAFRQDKSVRLIEFREHSSSLAVDARTPLPDLHHRALCLASGRIPIRQYLGRDLAYDEYLNIRPELGEMICRSLLGEATSA